MTAPDKGPPQTGIFVRAGEFWTIGYGGLNRTFRNSLGLNYLQRLLQHPGEEFHALDLLAGQGMLVAQEADSARPRSEDELAHGSPEDPHAILEQRAKQEFQRKIGELTERFAELRTRGAYEQAKKVADEIKRGLLSAVGLGGRDLKTGASSERARVNVTRALRGATQRIAEQHDALGKLLDESLRTGSFCSYLPKVPIDWKFS